MIKHLSVLPIFASLFLNVACDDKVRSYPDKRSATEVVGRGTTDPESGSASGTSTTPKGAFELKLDDLVSQDAPWGNIQINVERARLLRGSKPAGFPSSEKHSKDSIYAILDVKLDSNATEENDYTDRKTWDLLLANDKRVEPLNALGVKLAADETKTVSLFYKVEENTSLKGASLEINGRDRTKLEPMKIPLDAAAEFESQVKLADLVGETFEADEADFSFEIVNALYGVNLERSGRRADKDQRLVELTVRVSNDTDSSASFGASDEAVLLSVDGKKVAPEQFDSKTLSGGQLQNFVLVYSIEEDLSALDLVVDLGDEVLELSVDLPSRDGDSLNDDGGSDDENVDDEDEVDGDDQSVDDEEEVDGNDQSVDDEEEVDGDDQSVDDEEEVDSNGDEGDDQSSEDQSSEDEGDEGSEEE